MQKDKYGSLVSDIGGENPLDDVGSPWASYFLREMCNPDNGDLCILNADNYVWLVLELY